VPPFEPYSIDGPQTWEWRGDEATRTRRAVAMLASPELVGNKQVLIALCRIPAGEGAPWHAHQDHEEFTYVLSGRGQFLAEGRAPIGVVQGSLSVIPPGLRHRHVAGADEDLIFLWGYAPPGKQLQQ